MSVVCPWYVRTVVASRTGHQEVLRGTGVTHLARRPLQAHAVLSDQQHDAQAAAFMVTQEFNVAWEGVDVNQRLQFSTWSIFLP